VGTGCSHEMDVVRDVEIKGLGGGGKKITINTSTEVHFSL